ncbi:MAG: hypothetical protein ACK559_10525, partial [bacterium]
VGLAVEGAGLGPARGRSGVGGESRPAKRGKVLLPRIGAGRWQGRDAAQPVRPPVHGDDDVCGRGFPPLARGFGRWRGGRGILVLVFVLFKELPVGGEVVFLDIVDQVVTD